MKEKYFIVDGIRHVEWGNPEVGFWLCRRKMPGNVVKEQFFTDFAEAKAKCEELRSIYKKETGSYKEGTTVWFMNDNTIHVGIISDIFKCGDGMMYQISGCDSFLRKNKLFKTEEELLTHLLNSKVDLKKAQ